VCRLRRRIGFIPFRTLGAARRNLAVGWRVLDDGVVDGRGFAHDSELALGVALEHRAGLVVYERLVEHVLAPQQVLEPVVRQHFEGVEPRSLYKIPHPGANAPNDEIKKWRKKMLRREKYLMPTNGTADTVTGVRVQ
jgi:hypothetical protein